MLYKFIPVLAIGLWGTIVLPLSNRANAITPLTRAEIQNLRNLVQLIPKNNPKRPARKADTMIPGDGLSTGRASLAELHFNDGSLARVGEQAIFRFLPNTRNFELGTGTVLLLIPPGRGQTRIQTPNAAAAIRGSALFVRYDSKTDTTIIGALTNSGIEVLNKEASQSHILQAGQLMVVVQGKFEGLYDFDLRTFYQKSDLVKGLDLTGQNLKSLPDPILGRIRAETVAALNAQKPLNGRGVIDNPSFLQGAVNSANFPSSNSFVNNLPAGFLKENPPIDSLVETGQIFSNSSGGSENNINNTGGSTTNGQVGVDSTNTPTTNTPTTNTPNTPNSSDNQPRPDDDDDDDDRDFRNGR